MSLRERERERVLTPPRSDRSHRVQRQVASGAWLCEGGLGHSPGGSLVKWAPGTHSGPEPGRTFSPLSDLPLVSGRGGGWCVRQTLCLVPMSAAPRKISHLTQSGTAAGVGCVCRRVSRRPAVPSPGGLSRGQERRRARLSERGCWAHGGRGRLHPCCGHAEALPLGCGLGA